MRQPPTLGHGAAVIRKGDRAFSVPENPSGFWAGTTATGFSKPTAALRVLAAGCGHTTTTEYKGVWLAAFEAILILNSDQKFKRYGLCLWFTRRVEGLMRVMGGLKS
jgi:hypothetical protein